MIENIDMTEKEYREHAGVNKSTLWEMRKSPAHYKWATEHPGEDTPALKAGRLIHAAVLQPKKIDQMYAIVPEGTDRRTKEGKAVWNEFMTTVGDREIVTAEEMEEAKRIAESVMDAAGFLLYKAETEVPLFWDDPRTGILCKCRVDAMVEADDKIVLIDLKTTSDASTEAFTRSAVKLGYHVQAAHYMNGARETMKTSKPIEWWFIAVEKKEPYAVNIIRAGEDFIDEGQFRLMGLMDKLDDCMRYDNWPGYGISVITLPAWAIGGDEE